MAVEIDSVNTYEALLIFKPSAESDNMDALVRGVENQLRNLKGKILRVDKVGRKRLAYELKKNKDAFVAIMTFQLEPKAIMEFRKACQLNEDILRLTLVRAEHFDPNKPNAVTPVTSRDRDMRAAGEEGAEGSERPQHRGGFRGGPRGPRPFHHQGPPPHHQGPQAPQQAAAPQPATEA
jgi:small subunit ribosomal protein S6